MSQPAPVLGAPAERRVRLAPGHVGAPALTARGRALLLGATALLFVAGTSGQSLTLGLAATMLALIAGARVAGALRARLLSDLGIALSVLPGRRTRGEPVVLRLWLRNGTGRALDTRLTLHATGHPTPTPTRPLDIPARVTGAVDWTLRFPAAGHWRTHGVTIRTVDPLGLVMVERYHPDEAALTIHPRATARDRVSRVLGRIGSVRDPDGRLLSRSAGGGTELLELRDYVPGDPLKTVAWKATARRQRPLVRAFEQETVRTIQVILGIGPSLRAGQPGHAPLDAGVDLAARLIHLERQDRVGLTTFDVDVFGHHGVGRGPAHHQRLRQHLLELTRVVHADLTEITDSELFAHVGRFLERQEGRRLRRDVGDAERPQVARAMIDPLRELYDEAEVFAAVSGWLATGGAGLPQPNPAEDAVSARLRRFCALRGLPLPYRLTGPSDAAETGLSAAVNRNLAPRGPETLVILADLRALIADGPGVGALRQARARHRRVVAVGLTGRPDEAVARRLTSAGVTLG